MFLHEVSTSKLCIKTKPTPGFKLDFQDLEAVPVKTTFHLMHQILMQEQTH